MISSAQFFGKGRTVFAASAPARLDVMGGISDYSGSMVLEMPLHESTTAEIALRDDRTYRIYSTNVAAAQHAKAGTSDSSVVHFKLPARFKYETIASSFTPDTRWTSYIIGCAAVLIKEKGIDLRGADIRISSDVPPGRGISASAALEVSVMTALCKALGIKLARTELPALCQLAENRIARAPCGVMDQTASYLGRADKLLPIVCQPQLVENPIAIPDGTHFIGIDSRVEHSVGGSAYTDARTATFMGYEIIRKALRRARPFDGYLANVSPVDFEQHLAVLLPDSLTGRSFLRKYGRTIDTATTVRSSKTYAVRACTAHPIYENARVSEFRRILRRLGKADVSKRARTELLVAMGELMYQSHEAYSTIGLGHARTDELVNAAKKAGPAKGVFGARVSGGGSGGSVCVLVKGRAGLREATRIAELFTGSGVIFRRSSDGARWRKVAKVRT